MVVVVVVVAVVEVVVLRVVVVVVVLTIRRDTRDTSLAIGDIFRLIVVSFGRYLSDFFFIQ